MSGGNRLRTLLIAVAALLLVAGPARADIDVDRRTTRQRQQSAMSSSQRARRHHRLRDRRRPRAPTTSPACEGNVFLRGRGGTWSSSAPQTSTAPRPRRASSIRAHQSGTRPTASGPSRSRIPPPPGPTHQRRLQDSVSRYSNCTTEPWTSPAPTRRRWSATSPSATTTADVRTPQPGDRRRPRAPTTRTGLSAPRRLPRTNQSSGVMYGGFAHTTKRHRPGRHLARHHHHPEVRARRDLRHHLRRRRQRSALRPATCHRRGSTTITSLRPSPSDSETSRTPPSTVEVTTAARPST